MASTEAKDTKSNILLAANGEAKLASYDDVTLLDFCNLYPRIMAYGNVLSRMPESVSEATRERFREACATMEVVFPVFYSARHALFAGLCTVKERDRSLKLDQVEDARLMLKMHLVSLTQEWKEVCVRYSRKFFEPTLAATVKAVCGADYKVARVLESGDSCAITPAMTSSQFDQIHDAFRAAFDNHLVHIAPRVTMTSGHIRQKVETAFQTSILH